MTQFTVILLQHRVPKQFDQRIHLEHKDCVRGFVNAGRYRLSSNPTGPLLISPTPTPTRPSYRPRGCYLHPLLNRSKWCATNDICTELSPKDLWKPTSYQLDPKCPPVQQHTPTSSQPPKSSQKPSTTTTSSANSSILAATNFQTTCIYTGSASFEKLTTLRPTSTL
jgi:hypothetical protein